MFRDVMRLKLCPAIVFAMKGGAIDKSAALVIGIDDKLCACHCRLCWNSKGASKIARTFWRMLSRLAFRVPDPADLLR